MITPAYAGGVTRGRQDEMSNHSGSYMLNSMLLMLEREAFFAKIGPAKTAEFLRHILSCSQRCDCNGPEILDGIGELLAICDECFMPSEDLDHGTCASCRASFPS